MRRTSHQGPSKTCDRYSELGSVSHHHLLYHGLFLARTNKSNRLAWLPSRRSSERRPDRSCCVGHPTSPHAGLTATYTLRFHSVSFHFANCVIVLAYAQYISVLSIYVFCQLCSSSYCAVPAWDAYVLHCLVPLTTDD